MSATITNQPASTGSQQVSSGASNSTTSQLNIPQSVPAGLLTITQPPQTTVAFFKIAPSQLITFGWNFSYVLSTPASLTVSAICENGNTFPVGPTNGIIPGTATSVVWDAYAWQTNNPNSPLAQATYSLEIFDERGPGAARAPGLLQANNALKFALYTPQPYTPIASGWQCTGCSNGALTAHPAFLGVCLTIFVMFASGFALLRNSAR
ncbi:hypothetical protein B0F90DRAFT_1625348 [Multifurca ochricompacta]|uniref:DUF7137 domain-containing protein n=1 Tax=Multifurca ochricompacta TaxID=376703 RepID=A0AAD4M8K2_9AGAM|nr:hypothetical protein B0F90DRAFT_1625348 [Multifurca ochricompacta]